ncbi:hypothetical protein LZG04_31280 [Saccharothrix sp. S26]|uniref:effector-associated domain 2-containing protein n=1 Tax=Saccharothrix sp. S26 TaxID=2907215 RepID=UPI001F16129E|nr:hypothetical protein [Saccharothrix sp. S26]MCE6999256.1 hypothetical protein [Saccharothrix sp. S26]
MGSAAVHRSFVVVDVEGYGDPTRTTHQRLAARGGMYQVLMDAFAECGLPWDGKSVDDAGDSLIVVLPGEVPKARLVDRLPTSVAAKLREHNAAHSHGARLRMRMAVHFGEVAYDVFGGKTGPELIFVCRILDAAEAKSALKSSNATLVLIASDPFYQSVVVHHPAAHPDAFRLVRVEVKEVRAKAWVRLVDDYLPQASPGRPQRGAQQPTALHAGVEILLRTPGFDTREGRDLVLRDLPFAGSVPRLPTDRGDVVSILRTCENYPGGVAALVEAVRFYADGATAMAELDGWLAAREGE